MRKLTSTVLIILGFCVAACGSSAPDGSGGSGGGAGGSGGSGAIASPVPEAQFADQLAAVKCDLLFACGCPGTFTSKETCVNQTRAELQVLQQSAKDQHLNYDASCTGKLLAKLTERGCSATLSCDPDVCWPYYGTTTLGGACDPSQTRLTTTCAQGSTCWYHQGPHQATCGEPCSLEVKPEGTACKDSQQNTIVQCDVDLTCSEETGVCTPAAKAGEPCTEPNDCDSKSRCDLDNPAGSTCVALTIKPNGAACTQSYECVGGLCSDGKCSEWVAICDPYDFPR